MNTLQVYPFDYKMSNYIRRLSRKNFTTEAQSARRRKKERFGEGFLCELP